MLDHAGLRRTPAGLAALRLKVLHTGPQSEARHQRQVEIETELVAFGPQAEALAKVAKGSALKFTGFIDRKSAQNPQLELHVTEFGIIEE